MLEELRNLNYSPTQEGILYFIDDILGSNEYTEADIKVLCAHAPGYYLLSASPLLSYCKAFGWVMNDGEKYFVSKNLLPFLTKKKELNIKLIEDTVEVLFAENIFSATMFIYEANTACIRFKNEQLPLNYSFVRNTLISQGLFKVCRSSFRTTFYLSDSFIDIISKKISIHKKRLTLEQLKRRLEENEIAGEKAEKYALEYEQKRLPLNKREQVRIISSIDVSAGYDIVSFESELSSEIDRFIEVKAIGRDMSFYWSENEYEVAKLKGDKYYLYLVSLADVVKEEYRPMIICNPVNAIMGSSEWLVETQTYHIRHIPD